MNKKQKKRLYRIILSAFLLGVVNLFSINGILGYFIYGISYLAVGAEVLKKAFKGILNRRLFDESFLMAVATVGAVCLAVYEKSGDFSEAVAVMLFYQIGELFQSIAVGKSRKNIYALMDIRPDYANIEEDGELKKVEPQSVALGSEIIVLPGEKVPIDGVVSEGCSNLNTSALTGESLPKKVETGDEVLSGSVNLSGLLKIKTTKEFGESTVSKILELMETAGEKKSKPENFISKFAMVYTPTVCALAAALAVFPPLLAVIFAKEPNFGIWLYRALGFLVVSCPCALVIGIPLSFFAGIGGAGKEGILIKGSEYIESLSKVKTIVFDKTGTLTKGVFQVSAVHHNTKEEQKLLEYAAYAEWASNHPISKSLKEAWGKKINTEKIEDVQEISGEGVVAKISGEQVAAGNSKLMQRLGIHFINCHKQGTIVHMAINGEYAGHIVISDVIKPGAKKAVKLLKKAGVKNCVMLTGDNKKTAEYVANELEISDYHSELLPCEKVFEVENLLKKSGKNEKLAFVGDGINDAPVLSRADVGIAMGAIGSDAAIESADVVLMDDNPEKIAKAVKISKKCLSIVYQNIIFALGVKFACLALTAVGVANMWAAIFADVGVMVIAVLNAIRALRVKNL